MQFSGASGIIANNVTLLLGNRSAHVQRNFRTKCLLGDQGRYIVVMGDWGNRSITMITWLNFEKRSTLIATCYRGSPLSPYLQVGLVLKDREFWRRITSGPCIVPSCTQDNDTSSRIICTTVNIQLKSGWMRLMNISQTNRRVLSTSCLDHGMIRWNKAQQLADLLADKKRLHTST